MQCFLILPISHPRRLSGSRGMNTIPFGVSTPQLAAFPWFFRQGFKGIRRIRRNRGIDCIDTESACCAVHHYICFQESFSFTFLFLWFYGESDADLSLSLSIFMHLSLSGLGLCDPPICSFDINHIPSLAAVTSPSAFLVCPYRSRLLPEDLPIPLRKSKSNWL